MTAAYNRRHFAVRSITLGTSIAVVVAVSFAASIIPVLAYNLGNLWRRLVLPKRVDS
jgi:hypothetical protein